MIVPRFQLFLKKFYGCAAEVLVRIKRAFIQWSIAKIARPAFNTRAVKRGSKSPQHETSKKRAYTPNKGLNAAVNARQPRIKRLFKMAQNLFHILNVNRFEVWKSVHKLARSFALALAKCDFSYGTHFELAYSICYVRSIRMWFCTTGDFAALSLELAFAPLSSLHSTNLTF